VTAFTVPWLLNYRDPLGEIPLLAPLVSNSDWVLRRSGPLRHGHFRSECGTAMSFFSQTRTPYSTAYGNMAAVQGSVWPLASSHKRRSVLSLQMSCC
jgi:hypothetical protein